MIATIKLFKVKKISLIIFFLALLFSTSYGQSNTENLDGYRFAYVQELTYQNGKTDVFGLSFSMKAFLQKIGFTILDLNNKSWPKEVQLNPCQVLNVLVRNEDVSKVSLEIRNCNDLMIYRDMSSAINWVDDLQDNYNRSLKNIFDGFGDYTLSYEPSKTPELELPEVENTYETDSTLKSYFDLKSNDGIEGIYKSYQSDNIGYYKVGIKKFGKKYKAIILESEHKHWKVGEVKAEFEISSIKDFYSTIWYMGNKTPFETFSVLENNGFLSVEFTDTETGEKRTYKFIKIYPYSDVNTAEIIDGIKATGSGFFVSTDGVVATNAHVINGAKRIEVTVNTEFGNKTYTANVLLKDESNDVALLSIEDPNFRGLNSLPFSILPFTDIGENVFTIGYPLNSIMGDNYKVTNGIVSSNSGLKDDIRFMQITTPIQPGNSGGPLFNKDGNVVGLTTSKLNGKKVGVSVENVNYAIKASYLINIYNMLPNNKKFASNPTLSNKELKEQVKILKNYVCLLRVY